SGFLLLFSTIAKAPLRTSHKLTFLQKYGIIILIPLRRFRWLNMNGLLSIHVKGIRIRKIHSANERNGFDENCSYL
ncbi:MAG: hypothetical protein IJN11_08035, partial [Oscillospiraceae bacterium]|nr:hypothetical protein [Oscillospiraceae bacterium]